VSQDGFQYDLFVSYNRQDLAQVERLVQLLQRARLRVWLDEKDLPTGKGWRSEIQNAMNRSAAVLIVCGPHGLGPTQQEEYELFRSVERKRPFLLVPVLLPRSQSPAGTWFDTLHRIQIEEAWDEAETLRRLLKALGGQAGEAGIRGDAHKSASHTIYRRQPSETGTPPYDVFLSYNSKDRSEAQEIVRALEARGLRVLWDRSYLKIGKPWIPALEEAFDAVKAAAVLVGPDGLGRWQRREIEVALDRQVSEPDLPVIPVLLPRALPLPRFLALNTWVDLQKGVNDVQGIDLLAVGISGQTLSVKQIQSDAIREMVCPYRGLAAFREDDAEFFFGREAVVDQLVTALGKSLFVALFGSSGSGKSSVVHAGLIPELRRTRREEIWDFAFIKPTDKPLSALASALFPLIEPDKMGLEKIRGLKALAKDLAEGAIDLADLIVNGREKLTSTGRLLLVVDQWEELYTLCRDSRVRSRFLAQLQDAMGRGLLSVVCTVREDFIAKARDEASLGEHFERSKVHLRRMHFEELQEAIEKPAKKVGLAFEGGLAERILDDLGDEPGQLPLLEVVLTELWKRRRNGLLRHEAYEELGGGRKAIATRAEEIFNALSPGDQEEVRRLFLLLVRPGEGTQDTRRRAALTEIGEVGREVMWPLIDARLLTTSLLSDDADEAESLEELDPNAVTVELIHEALITHWHRLRKWLSEDRNFLLWRERLRLSRSIWEHEMREDGFLLTRAPLAEAEEWIEMRRRDLTKAEEGFIARSLDRHYEGLRKEVERQGRKRRGAAALPLRSKDLFISYAGEDRKDVAEPLALELKNKGWSVWFAENELVAGDRLLARIDDALKACQFGVVVLSPYFFAKTGPRESLTA
jgi:nucleotide-binding universal stress UspA family protein